jgi:hypothetical protein
MTATTFAKLIVHSAPATLEALAKAQIAGKDTGLEKHNYIAAIQKRGDLLFPTIASPQRRFASCLNDSSGALLYQALKAAPGTEVDPASATEEDPEIPDMPAMAQFRVLALDYARANPYKSKEQAFTAVYVAPANRKLREQAIAEQMAAAQERGKTTKAAPAPDTRADADHATLIAKYQAAHPEKSHAQCYVATLEGNPALAKRVLDAARQRAIAG